MLSLQDTAFIGVAGAAVAVSYEQTSGSASCVFQDGSVATAAKICGEMCANTSSVLFGKKITNIQISLQRQNSPGGTVYIRHYNSSDEVVTNYWNISADSLSTSQTWYGDGSFSGTDENFAVGDYFCSEYADAGAQYVLTMRSDSGSVFDGSNSHFVSVDNSDTFTTSGTTDDTNFKITVV